MDQWIFTAIGVAVVCVIAFWKRRQPARNKSTADGASSDTFSAADFSWAPGHHGSSGDFSGGHHGASGDFSGGDSGGGDSGGGDSGGSSD